MKVPIPLPRHFLFGGACGLLLSSLLAFASPRPLTIGAGDDCAHALRDRADQANCIPASSVPALGHLYPISEELFVSATTGRVGIGTTAPASALQVRGEVSATAPNDNRVTRMRAAAGQTFGLFETYNVHSRTNLVSSTSIDPSAGAIATSRGPLFLTLLTVPSNHTGSGYVAVRNNNNEVAGINGFNGNVFGASKSFVQPHPTDARREIQYVSLEGPEHGVYFRGSARTVDGVALVEVPESFRLVAREGGLTVSITALGPSTGLYVEQKSLTGIVVRENDGGSGGVDFDYHVMGVRSALPEHDPMPPNTHFAPPPGTEIAAGELPGSYRALMIGNGTLQADGRVDPSKALGLGWRFEDGLWAGGPAGGALPRTGDE